MQDKTNLPLSDLKSLLDSNKPCWIACNILDNYNEYDIADDKIILHCTAPEKTTTQKTDLTISNITKIYIAPKTKYYLPLVVLTKAYKYKLLLFF